MALLLLNPDFISENDSNYDIAPVSYESNQYAITDITFEYSHSNGSYTYDVEIFLPEIMEEIGKNFLPFFPLAISRGRERDFNRSKRKKRKSLKREWSFHFLNGLLVWIWLYRIFLAA